MDGSRADRTEEQVDRLLRRAAQSKRLAIYHGTVGLLTLATFGSAIYFIFRLLPYDPILQESLPKGLIVGFIVGVTLGLLAVFAAFNLLTSLISLKRFQLERMTLECMGRRI